MFDYLHIVDNSFLSFFDHSIENKWDKVLIPNLLLRLRNGKHHIFRRICISSKSHIAKSDNKIIDHNQGY